MTDTNISATRTIDAPAGAIFTILSNPAHHAALDGSGMVQSDSKSDRITATGQVFTMNMTWEKMGGDYQTDNHVIGYDENKLIAWRTAPAGEEPPGWEWVWRFESAGPDSTDVSVTYDWSAVTDKAILKQLSFPEVSQDALDSTLANLAAQVSEA
ncbi:polyketide cyclase [Arthrobacter agilis]|uniref:SRPBCC family protein n=1 Tax=Arthrobacter agilis TaxID=37921 RepID=UPI000B35A30F|nr:SRPBCC family protein [Arthrobacter agilis]OUM42346.1 polyketide cyclase [Arthrobacter agilis]PPB45688.1 polyketide cyclase [Arthrobacter agilis]TPV26332.1 polyketide cyclase [Arthrobacter agilis]WDF33418.1 SRPBCC family protein [Arthrobacter agilis]VDR30807.1 Polyketide cyclase / dehydrase and lipid transport [Arthrobacter agilis]